MATDPIDDARRFRDMSMRTRRNGNLSVARLFADGTFVFFSPPILTNTLLQTVSKTMVQKCLLVNGANKTASVVLAQRQVPELRW